MRVLVLGGAVILAHALYARYAVILLLISWSRDVG